MNHRNNNPPADHCNRTVAASRRITAVRLTSAPVRRLVPLVAALLLAGCFTGARPSFGNGDPFAPGTPTGDTNAAALLTLLDKEPTGPLHAEYDILTKYGNTTNPASVALSPGKRNITIGSTRFLQTESTAQTCPVDGGGPCANGFDVQRISNIGITPDFYAGDAAKRLRRDATAKVGPSAARTDVVAQQPVTCVDLPVPNGIAVYCVLDNGMLAVLDDGDVRVSLSVFGATVDPAAFTPIG